MTVWEVAFPILVNAVIAIGAGAVSLFTPVWTWLLGLAVPQQSSTVSPVSGTTSDKASIREAADKLIDAIALGDQETEDRLRPVVRIPYAQSQVYEATQAGDFDKARKLLADIEAMSGAKGGKVKA
jgi:hypothetical protein